MPTIPRIEYDLEKLNQFRLLANKAGADAVRYRIVERFLCEVDRWLLKLSPAVFDVARIKDSIQTLKAATMDADSSILLEAEFQLQREFQLWRQLIEVKDQSIETYNFRRFCDSAAEPLDDEIFVALAAFYRETVYSHTNQSKFDLVVTRLFTDVDPAGRRHLRFNAKEISNRAELLLGVARFEGDHNSSFLDTAGAVAAIQSFIAEAHALSDFESLIECRLFDRYREFKRELGMQFYEPAVIAAAIQCNVVFSNAFNEMLEVANDNLSEILKPEIDISAALHDPSPEARVHLSDLLNDFFDLTPQDEHAFAGKEGDHIWELLSLAGGKTENHGESGNQSIASPNVGFDISQSARERLTPLLETLTKPEPDAGLLLGQLNQSRTLRMLNLGDFLYSESYAPDMRSRRILGLILWLEEFVQNELTSQKILTPTGQQEALSLIQKSEELATNLRSEIQAADDTAKGRLLMVLNTLLESRLRLEGAIVRFTNRNLSEKLPEVKTEMKPAPPVSVERPNTVAVTVEQETGSASRWLLWLVLIAALAGAAYYFYPRNASEVIPAGNSVGRIDLNSLPNREYLSAAYRRERTIFVTAQESWTTLSTEKQKAVLRSLMEASGNTPIDSVVLRDTNGQLLGNASANGVYVPQEIQGAPDNKAN